MSEGLNGNNGKPSLLIINILMENDISGFEMSIRVLGNEFIGFKIAADDFKIKWLIIGLMGFAGIAAVIATFGPPIRDLFA